MLYRTKTLKAFAESHGASNEFLEYLDVSIEGRHLGRNKMDSALNKGRKPGPFGSFLTAMWEGDIEKAWMYADGSNSRLMEKAGLKPEN